MNWFTADTHFGHKNVIPYCNRPFASVEEMDAELIRRWNFLVKPDDVVFHLGDFAFCGAIRAGIILSELNGLKVLIRGNHDRGYTDTKWKRLGFYEVKQSDFKTISGAPVRMSHFPFAGQEADTRDFSKYQLKDNGGWLLHGHVHEAWKQQDKMINVGVDQWAYAPVSEEEISRILEGGNG